MQQQKPFFVWLDFTLIRIRATGLRQLNKSYGAA